MNCLKILLMRSKANRCRLNSEFESKAMVKLWLNHLSKSPPFNSGNGSCGKDTLKSQLGVFIIALTISTIQEGYSPSFISRTK